MQPSRPVSSPPDDNDTMPPRRIMRQVQPFTTTAPPMRTRFAIRLTLVTLGLPAAISPVGAQARHEIIRGRITTDSGRAVAGATVRSRRAPDRAEKSSPTDAAGGYSIDWPDGSGDYLMSVTAPGVPTLTRRLVRAPGVTDSVLVFDAFVGNRPNVQTLPTV